MAIPKPRLAARREKSLAPPSQDPYRVDMTESAIAVYTQLHKKSEAALEKNDPTNAHCTAFKMVQHAIKELIPSIAIDKRYALEGPLSNIFRLKKGRLRICWIASSEHRRVLILFISETLRKDGDANDPYAIFSKMVMSGQYNEFFERLGVKIPVKTLPIPKYLQ